MSARGVGASPLLDRLLDQFGVLWGAERERWRDRANGNGTRHRIYAPRDRRMPPCRAAEGRPTLASVYGLRSVRTAQPHASTCESP